MLRQWFIVIYVDLSKRDISRELFIRTETVKNKNYELFTAIFIGNNYWNYF